MPFTSRPNNVRAPHCLNTLGTSFVRLVELKIRLGVLGAGLPSPYGLCLLGLRAAVEDGGAGIHGPRPVSRLRDFESQGDGRNQYIRANYMYKEFSNKSTAHARACSKKRFLLWWRAKQSVRGQSAWLPPII